MKSSLSQQTGNAMTLKKNKGHNKYVTNIRRELSRYFSNLFYDWIIDQAGLAAKHRTTYVGFMQKARPRSDIFKTTTLASRNKTLEELANKIKSHRGLTHCLCSSYCIEQHCGRSEVTVSVVCCT